VSLKVLIVDDHLPSAELMAVQLEGLGAEVTVCHQSARAIQLVQDQGFDGIFLDLMMPGRDGFDVARTIRASRWNERTPIVVVTGREPADTMQRAFTAGGTFFLQKPVDRGKLVRLFSAVRGSLHENRRRFIRIPLRISVLCRMGSSSFVADSVNISQEGMLLLVEGRLRAGDPMEVEFTLPAQSRAIRSPAIVKRVDETGRAGIHFEAMAAADVQTLRALVAEVGEPERRRACCGNE
jgi:CheY-like chemotaxis protein